jgi:sec-independent protein translocase protein TatB
MFFGLTIEKLLLIGLIAAFVIGPERLPRYAENLATFTKRSRDWITNARSRVKDEMGDDFGDVDWKTLDPRQYDPRRIIREALLDDGPVAPPPPGATIVATPPITPPPAPFRAGDVPPYDTEAT